MNTQPYSPPTVAVSPVLTPESVKGSNLEKALKLKPSKVVDRATRVAEAKERGGFTCEYTMPSGTTVWTYERTDPAGVDKEGNPLRYTLHSDAHGPFSCTCRSFRTGLPCKHCEALKDEICPEPKPEILSERPGRDCTRCGVVTVQRVTYTQGRGYLIKATCPVCGMVVVL